MTMQDTLVLWHSGCYDGAGAAWACQQHFGRRADYLAIKYGKGDDAVGRVAAPILARLTRLPEVRQVVFVDICLSPRVMAYIADQAPQVERFQVIDHHQTTFDNLVELADVPRVELSIDMDHSGAALTWSTFHSMVPVPKLIEYIEDRDLWRWALPDSHAINDFIRTFPATLNGMIDADVALRADFDSALREGHAIHRATMTLVNQIAFGARMGRFLDQAAVISNTSVLQSESCHRMLELPQFAEAEVAIVWFQSREGRFIYSLRSRQDGPDVEKMARVFGGGGHSHAAGFLLDALLTVEFVDKPENT